MLVPLTSLLNYRPSLHGPTIIWTPLVIIYLPPDPISLVRWNRSHLELLPRLPLHAGVVARWLAEMAGARNAGLSSGGSGAMPRQDWRA